MPEQVMAVRQGLLKKKRIPRLHQACFSPVAFLFCLICRREASMPMTSVPFLDWWPKNARKWIGSLWMLRMACAGLD